MVLMQVNAASAEPQLLLADGKGVLQHILLQHCLTPARIPCSCQAAVAEPGSCIQAKRQAETVVQLISGQHRVFLEKRQGNTTDLCGTYRPRKWPQAQ